MLTLDILNLNTGFFGNKMTKGSRMFWPHDKGRVKDATESTEPHLSVRLLTSHRMIASGVWPPNGKDLM